MPTNPFSIPTAVPGLYQNQGIQSRDNLNELDPEEALAAQNLNRKQQIANLLMQRGLQPIQGVQAGRFYVPPNWAQGLAQLASAGLGAGLTNKFGEDQAAIGQQAAQQRAQAVQDYIRKTSPQEVTTELEGPGAPQQKDLLGSQPFVSQLSPQEIAQGRWQQEVDTQGPGAFQEGPRPTTTTMQAPSEGTKNAELIKVMTARDPSIRRFGELQFQAQQAEKEHAAMRGQQTAEKALDRDVRREGILENSKTRLATLENTMAIKEMDIAARAKAGEDVSEMRKELSRMQTERDKTIHSMDNETKLEIARMKAEADKEKAANKAVRALPGAVGGKFMENSQNLRMAERARDLLEGKTVEGIKGDPNAVGWKGYSPDTLLQRTDPKGVETRAAVANLGSMIIHDRSGAAVTASEYPRLKPFIPLVTDDPATAKKKLGQFVAEYQKINDEMTQFYTESGYKVPESGWHKSPETTEPAKIDSDAAYEALPSGAMFVGPDGKTRKKP